MGNQTNFDQNRYLELLKKKQFLIKNETYLFNENRSEEFELLSYGIILEGQIYYNQKDNYIFLVEEYLKNNAGEAETRLFVWEFFKIFKKNNRTLKTLEKEILEEGIEKLATFQIDPKSKEFYDSVNEIVDYSEVLTFDPQDTSGMNLNQFRDFLQKFYLKFKNA